jgi:PAS domain S-box-containing protein
VALTPVELLESLPASAASASRARALVREALAQEDSADLLDTAQLAVSEVVTNALVHAGTEIRLRIMLGPTGLRVEVGDGSPHVPSLRDYTPLAGTGRGLQLLDDIVDAWGSFAEGEGKVVWFELRSEAEVPTIGSAALRRDRDDAPATLAVELRNVPLLLHAAWQQHAAALLRDFLLVELDTEPDALERHARASDALNLLHSQLPAPELGEEPGALMATAIEPGVSLATAVLAVPRASVPNFQTLHDLLERAVAAADDGRLLVPGTQPEVQEMRTWLCDQVREQSLGSTEPVPWVARTDIWQPMTTVDYEDWDSGEVSASREPLLATDEASVVIAVSPSALRFLGFGDASELLGRRVITIIPARFRQAHIAGTTLHVVNGRQPLLGVRVTVPVLLADGTEATTELLVEPRRRSAGRKVFIAEFFPVPVRAAG